jgi:hypothetical protein
MHGMRMSVLAALVLSAAACTSSATSSSSSSSSGATDPQGCGGCASQAPQCGSPIPDCACGCGLPGRDVEIDGVLRRCVDGRCWVPIEGGASDASDDGQV